MTRIFIESPAVSIWWFLIPVSVIAFLIVVIQRMNYWWCQGHKLVVELGYMTPHVTLAARITRYLGFLLARRFFIGPVKVVGAENLKGFEGRCIAACNHQTERDAVLLPPFMGLKNGRALMAVSQIHGWRTPIAAWQGIVAVHHNRGPMAAVTAAIDVLVAEDDLNMVIFPQGKLVRDNQLLREDFFAGLILIAKKVAQKSKHPPAILPLAIGYDRDPAHKTLFHRLLDQLHLADKRVFFDDVTYGATLAVGKPIPLADLPKDRDQAMDAVFDEIVRLSNLADQHNRL